MGMQPVFRSYAQKPNPLPLGLILCSHCFEILNNFIFELVLYGWMPMDNVSRDWAEKTLITHNGYPPSLAVPFAYSIPLMSTEFWQVHMCRSSARLQASKEYTCWSLIGWVGAVRGYVFCSNQNLTQAKKRDSGILRNISDLGKLFLLLLLCISEPLKLKMMTSKERDIKSNTQFFLISIFPHPSVDEDRKGW